LVSLTQIQEVPAKNMILLVGPPGSGKSTFCHQAILQNLAMDKPIIYVTTEYGPSEAEKALKQQGLGEVERGLLNYVDAYNETVGTAVSDRVDTVYADCNALSSIDIAITKLTEQIGRKDVLLVFDSLTSPYLFGGSEILRFMRQTLSRFATKGNAVVASIDEGCGKPEDLVAMMSIANGIIETGIEKGKKVLNVVKHPRIEPTRIEVQVTIPPRVISYHFDIDYLRREMELMVRGFGAALRPEVGDLINIAWRDLIFWSGMLWDPKRFPTMMYELTKYSEDLGNVPSKIIPLRVKLLFKFMPKSYSKVNDMKKFMNMITRFKPEEHGMATFEYLEGVSKTDEHYVRLHEHYECWGFENIGTSLGIMRPALVAGSLNGLEKLKGLDRDWNAIEMRCIGLGDPYCEVKLVPGEIDGLKASLEKDSTVIERIHERLMNNLMGFLLHGKPLMERPTIGSGIHIHDVQHVTAAPTVNKRLQTVFKMGGAKAGKMLGERLMDSGLRADETVRRVIDFMEHCKVGKITLGETIRMRENCERFGIKTEQPSCYFTTGFLNGFFSAVKNQHVKEIRCIAIGDPYCEWEFR
jgi:predicted hydrocarbon binding protein/KaiC/GvpD/RAD55 family RecA-like ATPase